MHRTHTASKSKDQSADITKRGGKDGMKLGAFLANVACATMNTLISSDRAEVGVSLISCNILQVNPASVKPAMHRFNNVAEIPL